MPRNHSNRKDVLTSTNTFTGLVRSTSVEEVLEYFTKLATEKGIHLCGVRYKRGRLECEFKLPNGGAVAGKIIQLAVAVEGGHTLLVVTLRDPMNGALRRELEYVTHLAAHRIELLARRDTRAVGVFLSLHDEEDVNSTDDVRQEMYPEQITVPDPGKTEHITVLRDGETLKEFVGRIVLEIYGRELSQSGSHSAAARQLGMKRTTLYDWLEWARMIVTKAGDEQATMGPTHK